MTVTIDDIRAAAATIAGRSCARRRCRRRGWPRRPARRAVVLKLENLQLHRLVQGPRRLQQAEEPDAGRGEERRHRDVRGQPRAGRRLLRAAARHSRRHRHAAGHAVQQGRAHARLRRAGGDRGRHDRRRRGVRARSRQSARTSPSCIPTTIAWIVAGQGTIGLELMADAPDLDVIVVPIGGGGIMAGIATAAKTIKPDIQMIGVEAALYPPCTTPSAT